MIKSHTTICCTDVRQLALLDEYQWVACETKPELMLTNNMCVVIEDGFDANNFENALTGVAIDMGKQYPGLAFRIDAKLHSDATIETVSIEYHRENIAVHVETEDCHAGQANAKQICTYSIPQIELMK